MLTCEPANPRWTSTDVSSYLILWLVLPFSRLWSLWLSASVSSCTILSVVNGRDCSAHHGSFSWSLQHPRMSFPPAPFSLGQLVSGQGDSAASVYFDSNGVRCVERLAIPVVWLVFSTLLTLFWFGCWVTRPRSPPSAEDEKVVFVTKFGKSALENTSINVEPSNLVFTRVIRRDYAPLAISSILSFFGASSVAKFYNVVCRAHFSSAHHARNHHGGTRSNFRCAICHGCCSSSSSVVLLEPAHDQCSASSGHACGASGERRSSRDLYRARACGKLHHRLHM